MLTILEGSTFCVCDELGDIDHPTAGLFAEDTRFLSLFRLRLNGERPLPLSHGQVDYFSACFYARNPLVDGLEQDAVSVWRERFVGEGLQERIGVANHSRGRISLRLTLEFGSDFADIFAVKDHDFALGDPLGAPPLPELAPCHYDEENNQFLLCDEAEGSDDQTQVVLSRRGNVDGSTMSFPIELEPRDHWDVRVEIVPGHRGEAVRPRLVERRFGDERTHVRDSLAVWRLRVPQLRADWEELERSFRESVAALASLRLRGEAEEAKLPAAGMPWFMTVFGRDTIITSLQTLLFGPELARGALGVLARLQATQDDPESDAEPGKIVHEVRHGKAARRWFPRYYGTIDATPLFLVLLSEVWRWTDDASLARQLREPALRALEWIDRSGDRDGDGFIEYEKRTPRGLDNQSWKDSGDSQLFADGRLAGPPIAPCEAQGYVYDAKLRIAELAREVWRDRALADRLEREADDLKRRFDEAFWTDEGGGYYVLALDGDKRQVNSLCSNIGHLLWSGIVPAERADAVVDRLMGDALWSGWGVRTMSASDAGYNPLSYHNGTVWPHDNSLIAEGLARYGRWEESQRIVRDMLGAAAHFDFLLPEVFAGFQRTETPFPINYPTAARPQAWAAGAPVLFLRLLLGLRPDRRRQVLESEDGLEVPSWAGRELRLTDVRVFDRLWAVRMSSGRISVEEQ